MDSAMPSYHFFSLILLLSLFLCISAVSERSQPHYESVIHQRIPSVQKCDETCTFTLVESIPDGLKYNPKDPVLMPTFKAHMRLLQKAKHSVHLASFYWTLLTSDIKAPDNSSAEGVEIFKTLSSLLDNGDVEVKIAQNNTNNDTDYLQTKGASVRTLDFARLMHAGVMHTKMWVIDSAHIYLGSGNFDWRSYTQTKETGVLIEDCPCLGSDAEKLFEVYWYLGNPGVSIPKQWPDNYSTSINADSPALVYYNDTKGLVYLSSSPPPFCPNGRTGDIDAIVNVIRSARQFIYISVMDYIPLIVYTPPESFWPIIDDELRRAAIDHEVSVYLMASKWEHTLNEMYAFLKSLDDLHVMKNLRVDVQVKLFTVPSFTPEQKMIPFARVDHNKYMVTDQHAYIGTSNWSGDYFKSTGGVGFILQQNYSVTEEANLREQLVQVFLRDWHSNYTRYVH